MILALWHRADSRAILPTWPLRLNTSDFRGSPAELLVSGFTKPHFGKEYDAREDDDDDRVDDAIAVRDRALARRGAFLREPALVVRPPRTRGDFSRGVDARSRGGWGPLPARPREIRAGTFVSARPSRPSSRGTPCPRGTRTRRSRSRGSRTTPRRGTTARYARARPRSRRRTPPLARRSRGTHTRHSLVLFSSSRVGVRRTPSAASGWSWKIFLTYP